MPASADVFHEGNVTSVIDPVHQEQVPALIWTRRLASKRHTTRLGHIIGHCVEGGDVIAITGEVGVGKTVLVRGIAEGAGVDPLQVSSPTFTLIQVYRGRVPMVHVDVYRLNTPAEVQTIGLEEYWSQHTVVVIEWAEKILPFLPSDRLDVLLESKGSCRRLATLRAYGPRSKQLLYRIQKQLSLGETATE
ncbi:MAG: tRNA (adenosine(37)-N6)-threonylcarbamoyltransferase complex ATPase subunit type 1 TsaE [Nitrospirae bacterium]|nr:MAG: tRNA (adenosine(37)-N6)-threonylcarbamoyltransferase complex ATPase subunit type 1 TsaE [Nitrospirota bacterium]